MNLKYVGLALYAIIVLLLSSGVSYAVILNPAATYCKKMGYTYFINNTENGSYGVCQFPDGSSCEEWAFLKGKCGTNFSYCIMNGYGIKTVNNSRICSSIFSNECAVCTFGSGDEVEVTKLMNLSIEAGSCGDGVCSIGENYQTCPSDCPSGSFDGYCDGVSDGICDLDCKYDETPQKDPDCLFCGDGKCNENETCKTCPQDCKKCANETICGNDVCESGETQENCCKDCGCPKNMKCTDSGCAKVTCGNGLCEPGIGENYETCASDCPSGSADNYCDKMIDNRCDPDCTVNDDIDCKEAGPSIIIYAVVVLILLVIISLVVLKSKKNETYSAENY